MYTAEQQAAIEKALAERDDTGFCCYEQSTGVVDRGPQRFAVFGSTAFDITLQGKLIDKATDTEYEYIPACVDGHYWVEYPDEGRSGVLYLIRCLKRRGKVVENPEWRATWISCGWLHTEELTLSNAEIAQNIADEVIAGQTPITGGRPGWA